MPSTIRPLPKSVNQEPPSRLVAISPQNAALPRRFLLLVSNRLSSAQAAKSAPVRL